jgi:hypothetical protein
MSFNGKSTYDGGTTMPEIIDDVSDLVGIISPFETPLLNAIGPARQPVRNTRHDWLEDKLNPATTLVNNGAGYNTSATTFTVDDGTVFRAGDLVQASGSAEVMQVASQTSTTVTVTRAYGGTTAAALTDNQELRILGHASLEGEDAANSTQQVRTQQTNYTQIFTETVSISGSMDAVTLHGIEREFDYQVINRLRELMRQLEQSVIGGVKHSATPGGSASVRRTMGGILSFITGSNAVVKAAAGAALTEATLNAALRDCWEKGGRPRTIVCGGYQKRVISEFVSAAGQFVDGSNKLKSLIDVYESDFGVCRVILSRWVPADKVLLLDLDRIQVMPLTNRSFHVKPLAATGDYRKAQLLGEYTLEIANAGDGGHGLISGLATS